MPEVNEATSNILDNVDPILNDIRLERQRQVSKWGGQNHSLSFWMTILGEEFGESCKEVVEYEFSNGEIVKQVKLENLYDELIQTAAVAAAIAQQLRFGGLV